MVKTAVLNQLPISCPSCDSSEVALTYTAPVRVQVYGKEVVNVTVDDESCLYAGAALCAMCGTNWRLCEEPETGLWPARELGP